MLKQRIIPVLLCRGAGLVKGKRFDSWRKVGSALPAVRLLERRGVDELIFLDIGAGETGIDFDLIERIADECFMPLTVGGGIRSINDIRKLLQSGADKVSINTAAVEVPGLVAAAAMKFGSQCITVSIDVRDGVVAARNGMFKTAMAPDIWAKTMEAEGAGEILVNSVERDGMLNGYDLDLVERVADAVDIPVIACGGAGSYEHLAEGLRRAHAVAAGAMWHFTEATPKGAARWLQERGFATRC